MSIVIPRWFQNFDLERVSEGPEWTIETFWFAKKSNIFVKFWPEGTMAVQH